MKKLVSIIAILTIATPAFAATKPARPSYLTRNANGGYDVTYSYTDKAKSGWYGTLRAELSFLNWKNKYSTTGTPDDSSANHDDYSMKPLFTFNGAFGKRIGYFWRAEVEGGYITEFSDNGEGIEFKLSIPYVMANGYYDFTNGMYLGAGVGASFPITTIDGPGFATNESSSKTGVSPMFGLMLGYSHKMDDNIVLDLRYRFAGTWGTSQNRTYSTDVLTNKIGFIMDNSISLGIRYEF